MIFVITEIVCIPTGTSSALKEKTKKNQVKSPSMVSRPKPGSDPPFGSDRESGRDTGVANQEALGEPSLPLDKGKGRIDEIKYPMGSEYLKSAVQNALAVEPS